MKDAKFMSAKEKESVLSQWIRFTKNGFRREDFTESLYKHLSLHCAFIAHYNREGFFATYFERPETTAQFLSQFDKTKGCKSIEYGGMYWVRYPDFEDLNSAMCDATEPFKSRVYDECKLKERISDIRQAKALLLKHGIELNQSVV
jgi:hypothetical protein